MKWRKENKTTKREELKEIKRRKKEGLKELREITALRIKYKQFSGLSLDGIIKYFIMCIKIY